MKHLTRKEVEQWFAPIRKAIAEMKTGEVDSADFFNPDTGEYLGEFAVTRLGADDEYTRLDFCIQGWLGAIRRILPGTDVSAIANLSEKLASDEMLAMEELDATLRLLNNITKPLMRKSWKDVREAINQELMLIALEAQAEKAAA